MEHYTPRDHATSNVLAWTTTHSANVEPSMEEDAGADADEPPDNLTPMAFTSPQFRRTPVRRGSGHHESLLTKALQSQSDDETYESESSHRPRRRRSITSNTSLASTADLTCGTAITTPARTSSPSPHFPSIGFAPLPKVTSAGPLRHGETEVPAAVKKRCISFACAAKPRPEEKVSILPPHKPVQDGTKAEGAPKKTTIKFACSSQPPKAKDAQQQEPRPRTPVARVSSNTPRVSPTGDKTRAGSTIRPPRSPTLRRTPSSPVVPRNKKWLTANAGDLESESARFHEFASDEQQEDDWIRQDHSSAKPKLTIDDTLRQENAIRKLGKEAEEEAELEDEIDEEDDEEVDDGDLIDEDDDEDDEDDEDIDDEDEDEDDEDENEDDDEDDDEAGPTWASEASDGYRTDNEVGFADSDDEDDGLVLWTTRIGHYHSLSGAMSQTRRLSQGEKSDASTASDGGSSPSRRKRRSKVRPVPVRSQTPELPDSTDFVCGTLDEDRPLEEAYISCVEARRRGRHQPIPQDIDPSFPTSEPEDEVDEQPHRKGYGESDDHLWLHGELEDLDHDRDRRSRKKKGSETSPRRCRSPPPKRRPSPAPKARGRSPRKPSNLRSPRLRSPAPLHKISKPQFLSPTHEAEGIAFKSLAFRPGLTHTKSLPRAPGMFPHLKTRKPKTGANTNTKETTHVRGAIDIVKGLEQKRQRRKEKYFQKYYNRARKEKAQAKRPPPGQGASRMKELGLLIAGKAGPGNYVLSI